MWSPFVTCASGVRLARITVLQRANPKSYRVFRFSDDTRNRRIIGSQAYCVYTCFFFFFLNTNKRLAFQNKMPIMNSNKRKTLRSRKRGVPAAASEKTSVGIRFRASARSSSFDSTKTLFGTGHAIRPTGKKTRDFLVCTQTPISANRTASRFSPRRFTTGWIPCRGRTRCSRPRRKGRIVPERACAAFSREHCLTVCVHATPRAKRFERRVFASVLKLEQRRCNETVAKTKSKTRQTRACPEKR